MQKELQCPNIIKCYNSNMGRIDKNDMLVHLYQTPIKSRQWYIRLFANAINLCVVNSCLIYKHDCYVVKEKKKGLKKFRLVISENFRN